MTRVYLTKAYRFFHGGFRPVEYGPGEVDLPEDALAHARQIKGLLEGAADPSPAQDDPPAKRSRK